MKFVLNTLEETYHLISWNDRVFYFLPKSNEIIQQLYTVKQSYQEAS